MVSSHTSLPGLTIATHHNKLWLSLATTLPTLNSVLQIKSKTPKPWKSITMVVTQVPQTDTMVAPTCLNPNKTPTSQTS